MPGRATTGARGGPGTAPAGGVAQPSLLLDGDSVAQSSLFLDEDGMAHTHTEPRLRSSVPVVPPPPEQMEARGGKVGG